MEMDLIEAAIADESDESDEDDLLMHHMLLRKRTSDVNSWQSFSDTEFVQMSRFEKKDFERLREALRVPLYVKTRSRLCFDGCTALLIMLRRFAYPCRLGDVAAQFNISERHVSECVTTMVSLLYRNWAQLLDFHRSRFDVAHLRRYQAIIRRTGCPLERCVGFIDGTLRPTSRPGEDQRVVYNGHKRVHGLKFQAVVTPDGIVSHLAGPHCGNKHDSSILRETGLLAKLDTSLRDQDGPFLLYGDGGYPLVPQLLCPYKGATVTRDQKLFNTRLSKVRIAVEMSFGKVIQYFAFLDYKKNLKILLQPVAKYYMVATILTNCHTCLYESAVTALFASNPPLLEEYLAYNA